MNFGFKDLQSQFKNIFFLTKILIFTPPPPARPEKHPQFCPNFVHFTLSRECHFLSLAILTLKHKKLKMTHLIGCALGAVNILKISWQPQSYVIQIANTTKKQKILFLL